MPSDLLNFLYLFGIYTGRITTEINRKQYFSYIDAGKIIIN